MVLMQENVLVLEVFWVEHLDSLVPKEEVSL